MEGMTVPFLSIVTGIIVWAVWLTKRVNKTEKDVAVNTANDQNVAFQIKEFKEDVSKKIDKLEFHVNAKFEKITTQFEKVFDKIDQIKR